MQMVCENLFMELDFYTAFKCEYTGTHQQRLSGYCNLCVVNVLGSHNIASLVTLCICFCVYSFMEWSHFEYKRSLIREFTRAWLLRLLRRPGVLKGVRDYNCGGFSVR